MAKVTKLFATVLCGSMILTGCGSAVTQKTTSSATSTSTAEVNLGTRAADTFEKGTTDYTLDHITFSVPNDFGKPSPDGDTMKTWNITRNANVLRVESQYGDYTQVSDEAIIQELLQDLSDMSGDTSSATLQAANVKQFQVGDFDATSFEVQVPADKDLDGFSSMMVYFTYILNAKSERLDTFYLAEADNARYSYKNDYYKMIDSLKVQ